MIPIAALPFPTIDPVALQLGPLAIRWYALAYVAGLLIGWWVAARLVSKPSLFGGAVAPTKLELDDMLLWAALGIVVGGRIGYVLFYNPGFFIENPLEIPQLWNGGMSFHGGAAGLMFAAWLYTKVRTVRFLTLMDVLATVAPIGIFFGRIANFINGELYGRVTDVWWAVEFPRGGYLPRHPSQLYEAVLEGAVLFLVLIIAVVRGRIFATPGVATGIFIAGYGLARFLVEFAREPDPQLGTVLAGLTMGQILSAPMIVAGLALIAWARRQKAAVA